MRLPQTAAPLFFCMETGPKFTTFNQTAYPALRVLSSVNRANDTPILQYNPGAQPLWKANVYRLNTGGNNPGYQQLSNLKELPETLASQAISLMVPIDTLNTIPSRASSTEQTLRSPDAAPSSLQAQAPQQPKQSGHSAIRPTLISFNGMLQAETLFLPTCRFCYLPLAADTNVHQLTAVRQDGHFYLRILS